MMTSAAGRLFALASSAVIAWSCATQGGRQATSNPDAIVTEKDIQGKFMRLAKKGEHAVAMNCETPQALKGGSVEGDAGQTPEGQTAYSICDVTHALPWADFVKLADTIDATKTLSSSVESAEDSGTITDDMMRALVSQMKPVEKKDPPSEEGLNLNGNGYGGGGGGYSGGNGYGGGGNYGVGLVYVVPVQVYYYTPSNCEIWVSNRCTYDVQVNLMNKLYTVSKGRKLHVDTITQGEFKIGIRHKNSYGKWDSWSWERDVCSGMSFNWNVCNR